MVLHDVLEGKVSPERANGAYGVVVTEAGRGFVIDREATRQLRSEPS
jgi:hypothetical protein